MKPAPQKIKIGVLDRATKVLRALRINSNRMFWIRLGPPKHKRIQQSLQTIGETQSPITKVLKETPSWYMVRLIHIILILTSEPWASLLIADNVVTLAKRLSLTQRTCHSVSGSRNPWSYPSRVEGQSVYPPTKVSWVFPKLRAALSALGSSDQKAASKWS